MGRTEERKVDSSLGTPDRRRDPRKNWGGKTPQTSALGPKE